MHWGSFPLIIGVIYAAFLDSAVATRPTWMTPVIIIVGVVLLILLNLPYWLGSRSR